MSPSLGKETNVMDSWETAKYHCFVEDTFLVLKRRFWRPTGCRTSRVFTDWFGGQLCEIRHRISREKVMVDVGPQCDAPSTWHERYRDLLENRRPNWELVFNQRHGEGQWKKQIADVDDFFNLSTWERQEDQAKHQGPITSLRMPAHSFLRLTRASFVDEEWWDPWAHARRHSQGQEVEPESAHRHEGPYTRDKEICATTDLGGASHFQDWRRDAHEGHPERFCPATHSGEAHHGFEKVSTTKSAPGTWLQKRTEGPPASTQLAASTRRATRNNRCITIASNMTWNTK